MKVINELKIYGKFMGNKWKVCKINSLVNIMSSYINYYQKQYRKHNRERIGQLKQELCDLYKSEFIQYDNCFIGFWDSGILGFLPSNFF